MDWDRIEGNWKQFTGKVKEKWGDLTDDEIAQTNGKREQLEGLFRRSTATPRTRRATRSIPGRATSSNPQR